MALPKGREGAAGDPKPGVAGAPNPGVAGAPNAGVVAPTCPKPALLPGLSERTSLNRPGNSSCLQDSIKGGSISKFCNESIRLRHSWDTFKWTRQCEKKGETLAVITIQVGTLKQTWLGRLPKSAAQGRGLPKTAARRLPKARALPKAA